MVKVAEAIEYAHSQGVIHRDIKPSNILLDHDFSPFIADFGLARDKDENEITLTLDGEVLGTAAYMSPEQARGDAKAIHWTSDVYSMGVVLYKMLAGELPFHGNRRMMISQVLNDEPSSVRRLNEHVPRDLDTITLKAIAKEPKYRYATAREFADDLRRWLDNEPIVARRRQRLVGSENGTNGAPMVAALSATIALLLLVGTGLSITWAIREAGLREISNKNLSLATENRLQSDARLQKLFVQNGAERLAQSDPLTALAWFDVALNSPNHQHDLHRLRIGRTLAQLPILTHLWDAGKSQASSVQPGWQYYLGHYRRQPGVDY